MKLRVSAETRYENDGYGGQDESQVYCLYTPAPTEKFPNNQRMVGDIDEKEDAERIVECVNICENISNLSSIKELIEAAKLAVEMIEKDDQTGVDSHARNAFHNLSDALKSMGAL